MINLPAFIMYPVLLVSSLAPLEPTTPFCIPKPCFVDWLLVSPRLSHYIPILLGKLTSCKISRIPFYPHKIPHFAWWKPRFPHGFAGQKPSTRKASHWQSPLSIAEEMQQNQVAGWWSVEEGNPPWQVEVFMGNCWKIMGKSGKM